MIEFLTCTQCGGQREHNLRTGEVGLCDTCFGEMNPPEHIRRTAQQIAEMTCGQPLDAEHVIGFLNVLVQSVIEEIYTTGKYDFGNGSCINILESGVFKGLANDKRRLDSLQEQIVDTIYLDDGRIIDVRGGSVRAAIDAAMDLAKSTTGEQVKWPT